MAIKYRFRATKSLGLTVTVYAGNEDDAEEQAQEIVDNTNYDEWDGADEDGELELIDEEPCDEDSGNE